MNRETRLLGLLLSCLAYSSVCFGFSGTGSGTSIDPYEITTCDQLTEIASATSAYYELANSIDCTAHGAFTSSVVDATFQGSFNGNFHTISGITINASTNNIGLFKTLNHSSPPAVVQDLIISGAAISSTTSDAGILAGQVFGATVSNVFVSGSVFGVGDLGGLIGLLSGPATISGSASSASVTASTTYAGGLVGAVGAGNSISNSYATGNVSGASYIGGLFGSVSGPSGLGTPTTITNCYSSGDVSGTSYVGGIAGYAAATVQNSFATGQITNSGAHSGGCLGANNASTLTLNYFDVFGTGLTSGVDGANLAGCTGVNAANATPDYFLGNATNPPMSSWNFSSTWVTAADSSPLLTSFAPTPTPSPTSIAVPAPTEPPSATPIPTPLPTATPIGSAKRKIPKLSVKIASGQLSVRFPATLSGHPKYLVMVINVATESLFKRVRATVKKRVGTIKLKNVPTGTYRIYYYTKLKKRKYHSKLKTVVVP